MHLVVCGPNSAIGLEDSERQWWPHLRERLRQPGRMMAVMRGVLGGDAEVAAIAAVRPDGVVHPLALLATPVIRDEITFTDDLGDGDLRAGDIGGYPVEVLVDPSEPSTPVAVLITPWIFENLTLYTRKLWSRR